MKTLKKTLLVAIVLAVSFMFLPASGHAADDMELNYSGTIYDRLWVGAEFPLTWYLHEDGVINNDVVGAGTGAVSNADATTELGQAFNAWQGVGTANISFSSGGETTTGTTGCDRENIVTWSDTGDFGVGSSTIARGITTYYWGPSLVIDDINRATISCSSGGTVALDAATYPNGTVLNPGTVLDMDLSFNSANKDFVTAANVTFGVADIESIAVHEFGHLIALSHVSLDFTATSHRATMYPSVSTSSITSQTNVKTLEIDDNISAGRRYPSVGFWPSGTAPYTTGAISGNVTEPDGTAVEGIRVWAYEAADTTHPVAEAFTTTDHDWDASVSAGEYTIPGLPPGDYHLCIVPWNNGVGSDDPSGNTFNRTANDYSIDTFDTECFDDVVSSTADPEFDSRVRTVTVEAGETRPNIDFVTGSEQTDLILVMDRSGSMNGNSGTAGVTKLEALQSSVNELIDYLNLAGGHRLGLVQFEEVLVPLTPVFDLQGLDAGNVGDAHDAINTMSGGGWTNIIDGVNEGVNQLTTIASPNDRQVMVVFSDGKHNRPVGSDLNDINTTVVDNDIRLYSIGFGTDVDDAILTDVAENSGGIHVNEQDLNALALSKHFMIIGASAIDETLIVDPMYTLGRREKAKLDVGVSGDDKSLTFAVSWVKKQKGLIRTKIRTPGRCTINDKNTFPGVKSVRKDNYTLIRVDLPFRCGKKLVAKGTWRVVATGAGVKRGEDEDVEILVIGASGLRLFGDVAVSKAGALITAKLVRNGIVQDNRVKMYAEILPPLPRTYDSELQDKYGAKYDRTKQALPRPKIIRRELEDDCMDGDDRDENGNQNQGVFSTVFKPTEPGLYRVRIVAKYRLGKQTLSRESVQTFYYPGFSKRR